ncbi:hypothetical protein TNCV_297271 [Trichonephila clavipes]|nr:hypothetical protein TNCV_297271 [Trichonephila clavipes]
MVLGGIRIPDFHKRILFSDEAHFWLNGYVNKQNCCIWSEANSQVYVETPLHPEKLFGALYGLVESLVRKCSKKSLKIGRPEWTTSEPSVAIIYQKSYLKFNATRLSFE